MVTIYKITSPTGRIYIGQTTNLSIRVRDYKRNTCKIQTKLYSSLRKYGFDNHIFEVIEKIENILGDEREIYWIAFYKSYGTKKGMNMTPGGKRTPGIKGKSHYKAKIIYQYDLHGNLINKWDCIKDAERKLGISSTVIGRAAKQSGYCHDFIWSFRSKKFSLYISTPGKKGIFLPSML